MKSNLTTQERFSSIEAQNVPRSQFDRSFGHKTTIDAGKLYPLYWDLALPGDTFKVKPTIFGRIATPLKPIMDNIYVDMHFFSVPYRLVMDDFKKLMGEQENPEDSTNYTIPMMSPPTGGYQEQSIYDYLGLPTKVENFEHMSLILRAYNLIFNEWYRDENLQDSVLVKKDNTVDTPETYKLLTRNKRKDYFTSALPFAQKSSPVSIPLGGTAPVTGTIGVTSTNITNTTNNSSSVNNRTFLGTLQNTSNITFRDPSSPAQGDSTALIHPAHTASHDLEADLSEATAVTINALREAVAFQQFFELDARGGTRYTELIKAHFNVTSPDARLQRPEYLGGGSSPLTMQPIAQQSASADGETPQGNLAAMGVIQASNQGFVKTFTEHEIILGIASIRTDINYQQGVNRLLSQKTRFDFYWPTFNNLGEQAILRKELVTTGTSTDEEVFGYQERYAEYRYRPSQITGLFRSNAAQSLDIWHLAQELEPTAQLNADFIEENPPIDRVIAVPSEPQFILDCFFDNMAARPLPVRSTPGLLRL